MIEGKFDKDRINNWKYESNSFEGLHLIISPETSDCEVARVYRLNISAGNEYELNTEEYEMSIACVKGDSEISFDNINKSISKLDSIYLVKYSKLKIKAKSDSIFYIGAAIDEGYGENYVIEFDSSIPLGDIHQIHGEGIFAREVFMTVNPEVTSSRILSGLTWSGDGGWTSWPPHEHEKYLEEVYCYFDMDELKFGLHLSYVEDGETDTIVPHIVKSGSMVLAPRGFHPTVASPGTKNSYFWILFAHSHDVRRYDLAREDSTRSEGQKR